MLSALEDYTHLDHLLPLVLVNYHLVFWENLCFVFDLIVCYRSYSPLYAHYFVCDSIEYNRTIDRLVQFPVRNMFRASRETTNPDLELRNLSDLNILFNKTLPAALAKE